MRFVVDPSKSLSNFNFDSIGNIEVPDFELRSQVAFQ